MYRAVHAMLLARTGIASLLLITGMLIVLYWMLAIGDQDSAFILLMVFFIMMFLLVYLAVNGVLDACLKY